MVSYEPLTDSSRYCDQCGMKIPPELEQCPHDEGALLIKKSENLVGQTLGTQYEITALVGIGGMSAVYKAHHKVLDRIVAVKVLHPHLVVHQASLQRFEQEAKAVSHLSHPHIVNVYEYGYARDGQPFLVMDYLEGLSLSGVLNDAGHLDIERTIKLALPICDAIAHAHKKGILHRDLKPSNIMLVRSEEGVEVVKIVDFGLAKLLPSADMEVRRLTQSGEVFGSPIYMSPEQVSGRTLDERTDVFAMGCVIYEMLAGRPPFVGLNIMETMMVRLTDPPPPFDPALCIPQQLETIILIALAREPAERYASMGDLGRDLKLFLDGSAESTSQLKKLKRPSALKKVLKVDAKIFAAVLFCVVAIAGLAIWKVSTMRPGAGEEIAWVKFDREGQKLLDQGNFAEAERSLVKAVKEAERFGEYDRRLLISLDKLGRTYEKSGKTPDAERVRERLAELKQATSVDDNETNVESLIEMTLSLVPAAEKKADPEECRKLSEKLNTLALFSMNKQELEVANELLQTALVLEKKVLKPEDPAIARTLTNLAVLYGAKLGRLKEAETLLHQALSIRTTALGAQHPEVANNLYNLAVLYENEGRNRDAEQDYKQALKIYEKACGHDSAEVAKVVSGLGGLYRQEGKLVEAGYLLEEAVDIYEKGSTAEPQTVAAGMNNLAGLYYAEGRYKDAVPLYSDSVKLLEKALGVESPLVADALNNLAVTYLKQGDYKEAEPLFKRALAIRERNLPGDHPAIAQSLNSMAELYRAQHKLKEAEPLYKNALEIDLKVLGPDDPEVAMIDSGLARLYEDQGKYKDAEELFKNALKIREKAFGPEHPACADIYDGLAGLYAKQGNSPAAETAFKKALAIREKALGTDHPEVAATLDGYAQLLYKTNRLGEAASNQVRAAGIRLRSFLHF